MGRGYFVKLPRDRIRVILIAFLIFLLLLLCFTIILWIISPDSRLVANPGGPYTINEGQPLAFNGSGSIGNNITGYTWNFGDNTTGNGVSPSHTYEDGPAQFTVILTVTDNQGQMATATTQVTVNNLPPTAEANGPYTCQTNETIQLVGVCDDPSPIDDTSLSCVWADFSGAALSQPSYTCPSTPGGMTVTLTATDKDGASAQDSAIITISNGNGDSTIMADANGPYTGTVGSPVSFDGSGSQPADLIETYMWDFGNGQIGQGVKPSAIYNEPGIYNVTLTVTGNGQTNSDSTTVTINPLPPQPPKAIISLLALCAKNGFCYRFDGSLSTGADSNQIIGYEWNLGDGTIQQGAVVEHEYTNPGLYTITLTVTDNIGTKDNSSIAIRIP